MKIRVAYPSGISYTVDAVWLGNLQMRLVGSQRIFERLWPANIVMQGDPRALHSDEEHGHVLYNPREHMAELPRVMREWLTQHPEWPGEVMTGAKNAVP